MPASPESFDPLLKDGTWEKFREWHRSMGRHDLPWRKDSSPWGVLLAEVLLHRTRAQTVADHYPELIKEFPDPSSVVSSPEHWLQRTEPLGLFWRSENFLETCEELLTRHNGAVPEDREALLDLSGVGQYIADAVRCFGFGHPGVIVDSNTIRIAARVTGSSPDAFHHRTRETRRLVARLGESSDGLTAGDNYALLDLGGLICLPQEPACENCPLSDTCATGQVRLTG